MTAQSGLQKVTWDHLTVEKMGPGLGRRFVTGDKLMVSQLFLKAGTVVPKHSHGNEQVSNLISGRLEFSFGEDLSDVRIAAGGDIIVIPGGVPHKVVVLEDCVVFDTFAPPRQDWLDGTDDYLRGGN